MTYEEVRTRLNKVFCNVFNNDGIIITEQTTANDIEQWDSLKHLTLISETEEEFGINFSLKELVAMRNVGDYIRIIVSKADR